jgi:Domain of unknown function (DUF4157)
VRRLTDQELNAYDLINRDVAERVRIVTVPVLAPGTAGMTVGRFVLLRSDDDHSGQRELLAHELVHVRQYAEVGFVRFLLRYFRDYLRELMRLRRHRCAYLAIPSEVEARAEAAAWKQRR